VRASEPSIQPSGPFHLSDWSFKPQPQPVPGCAECAELSRRRGQARKAGDGSLVSDCNVRIATHDTGHAGAPAPKGES